MPINNSEAIFCVCMFEYMYVDMWGVCMHVCRLHTSLHTWGKQEDIRCPVYRSLPYFFQARSLTRPGMGPVPSEPDLPVSIHNSTRISGYARLSMMILEI